MTEPPTTPFDQVLLTRFNLPSKGVESLIRAADGWLRGRVELFERYTLPSVQQQSVTDFHWLVYFDPQSPRWLLDKIETWSATSPLRARFREEAPPEVLIEDLAELIGAARTDPPTGIGAPPRPTPQLMTHLMTTNLDNDDGLATDFLAGLRSAVPVDHAVAVFVPDGLIRRGGQLYSRTDHRNAFCSVLEPWSSARGCWAEWHNLIDQTMPVVELSGPPGWLQVIHGTNVSNRVRGRLISPTDHRTRFGGLLDDLAAPPTRALVTERVLARPARQLRDSSRKIIKGVALRLLGKEGLDRVKFRAGGLARVRNRVG